MKEYTKEELAAYNGKNGAQVLVAYNGNVHDFSRSSRWEDGEHENLHTAGKDLTYDLETLSPHGAEVIGRFPIVGTLRKD